MLVIAICGTRKLLFFWYINQFLWHSSMNSSNFEGRKKQCHSFDGIQFTSIFILRLHIQVVYRGQEDTWVCHYFVFTNGWVIIGVWLLLHLIQTINYLRTIIVIKFATNAFFLYLLNRIQNVRNNARTNIRAHRHTFPINVIIFNRNGHIWMRTKSNCDVTTKSVCLAFVGLLWIHKIKIESTHNRICVSQIMFPLA